MNDANSLNKTKKDEFVESLAKIAVAQICENIGLKGVQTSALDLLSDVMCKYVKDVGKMSCFYANLAGRTESNVFDVVRGLEDLGVSQGFVGCSDVGRCLLTSGVVKEVEKFVGVSEEVGFAYSVPEFPVVKERDTGMSFFKAGVTPRLDCVPSWLPCFPDPETYRDSIEQDEKVVETSLLKPEQRVVSNGCEVPVVENGHNNNNNNNNNPFLVSPLKYGEKEVSLVSVPKRLVMEEDVAQSLTLWAKDVSPLGRFASVINGSKSNDFDTENGRKEVGVKIRPVVKIKLQTGKKSLATGNRDGNLEAMFWFGDDDSRDDKRRKKEVIVNESFENGKNNAIIQPL